MTSTPRHSPWGETQQTKTYAPGIVWFSTAGHAGFWISPERRAEMSSVLRSHQPFAGTGWYEEDCDWAIVVTAFPGCFTDELQAAARESIKMYQPGLAARLELATLEGGVA